MYVYQNGSMFGSKEINLKFAGRCKKCGTFLDKGIRAIHSRAQRSVFCKGCYGSDITLRRPDYINDLWIEKVLEDDSGYVV